MSRPVIVNEQDADWGGVGLAPIPVDGTTPSIPTDPAAQQAQTQAVLTDNEQVRQQQMASTLAPPPAVSPIAGRDRVSSAWLLWFEKLRERVGGAEALNTEDLEILGALVPDGAYQPKEETSLDYPDSRVAALSARVDGLALMVLCAMEGRGWNRQKSLTADSGAAPAGGTGTAAGAWDTALNRDAAIATINNLRTRLNEIEARLKVARIL